MNSTFFKYAMKHFSVLPKASKMELTMRTPYRTVFKDFIGFQRIYVNTIKGLMCISNRTPPVIYLLPAGEIKITNMTRCKHYSLFFFNLLYFHIYIRLLLFIFS
jgi:hypothetical protein